MKKPNITVSEVDRQRKVVYDVLEKDKEFSYQIFNSKLALLSQRKSNYKDTARAAREIVDNAIEAGGPGTIVYVIIEPWGDAAPFGTKKTTVKAIYFVDDAGGMFHDEETVINKNVASMIRYSLTWGGGTHAAEEDQTGIGKFGFGLPNSSISQCTKTSVYSSIDGKEWWVGVLDIDNLSDTGSINIPPVTKATGIPEYPAKWLKKNGIELESGTCVVWEDCDRITYSTTSNLADHLAFDFSMTYRDYLGNINLYVNKPDKVEKIDPTFQDPKGKYYLPPVEAVNDNKTDGGSRLMFDETISVKYWKDKNTGQQHLTPLLTPEAMDDAKKQKLNPGGDMKDVAIGDIAVRVCRLPYGFAAATKGTDEDSRYRLNVRTYDTGYHFVRAGREIEVKDCAPHSARDVGQGLGSWSKLQNNSAHYPIEFSFTQELDEAFRVGSDKQHIDPIRTFWKCMSTIGVDKAIHAERLWREETAKTLMTQKDNAPVVLTPAVKAVRKARALADLPTISKADSAILEEVKRKQTEIEAKALAKQKHISIEEASHELVTDAQDNPFVVDYVDIPGGDFFTAEYGKSMQLFLKLNRKHPFYADVFSMAKQNTKNGIVLMLEFLARKELDSKLIDPNGELAILLPSLREELSRHLAISIRALNAENFSSDEKMEQESVAGRKEEEEQKQDPSKERASKAAKAKRKLKSKPKSRAKKSK